MTSFALRHIGRDAFVSTSIADELTRRILLPYLATKDEWTDLSLSLLETLSSPKVQTAYSSCPTAQER